MASSVASDRGLGPALTRLCEALAKCDRIFVLTGAGVSTHSGIVDYRDDHGAWKHRQPMRLQEFTRSQLARQRYWARSLLGFPRIDAARPNAVHQACAGLEQLGRLNQLVTQNVDGLHQKAGSQQVIDLHGRLDTVECLGCKTEFARSGFQHQLAELNPSFTRLSARTAPDGDADLPDVNYERFLVPPCERCGGLLKPSVVFFGESVPASRVHAALGALQSSQAVLVLGSSLMVFSGFRFARAAARFGLPLFIINRGKTRADELALLKVQGDLLTVVPELVAALGCPFSGIDS